MNLPTFPQPRPRQREPETERKLQQIIRRSGIITFDNIEYRTELRDLEDLGELGHGTSGHVFKMRHKPSNRVMAVKVIFHFFGFGIILFCKTFLDNSNTYSNTHMRMMKFNF